MTAKNSASLVIGLIAVFLALPLALSTAHAKDSDGTKFRRIPTQFIAALADPDATAGTGAQTWGIWRRDPGPRGVRLRHFKKLQAAGGIAPANWHFDSKDWWLEENGLLMEKPDFPVPPGKYVVTGDREVAAVLTIHPPDPNGATRWELADGAKMHDVTHLPCRSARYTPQTPASDTSGAASCTPANAPQHAFRVTPGAPMPAVPGCAKQDYAVLFIIAVAVED